LHECMPMNPAAPVTKSFTPALASLERSF
jgi:hypothetical protein